MTKFKGFEVNIIEKLVKQEILRVRYSYLYKDYYKSLKLILKKNRKTINYLKIHYFAYHKKLLLWFFLELH